MYQPYDPYYATSLTRCGTQNVVITITGVSVYTQTTAFISNYPNRRDPDPEPEPEYSLEPKTPPGTRPACWPRPEFRRPARVCAPRVPEAVRWRLYARRCLGEGVTCVGRL